MDGMWSSSSTGPTTCTGKARLVPDVLDVFDALCSDTPQRISVLSSSETTSTTCPGSTSYRTKKPSPVANAFRARPPWLEL